MEEIEFRNFSFAYPGCEERVLKNIDFSVRKSEFIVICGKSGCGKSTLLRQLKKSMIPYGDAEGEVLFRGQRIGEMEQKEASFKIGFVSQSPDDQIVTNTVWHEMAFGLESLGLSNQVIQKRVAEMASYFGIQTWFRKDVFELSGGQKQILNLASVMVMQPEVLVLDEPTSQLDPITAAEFIDTLSKINREIGTTIILSEHRLEELFPAADRILVMADGQVDFYGSPAAAGKFLTGQGERHEMYYGMPAIMKIFSELPHEENAACPVTVKEGREYLAGILPEKLTRDAMELPGEESVGNDSGDKRKETPVAEFRDVWFRYDRKGNDVIRGLSLKVKRGELLCILGGNGVGKSTSIRLLGGILTPYDGKILIDGEPVKKAKLKVGILPQNPQSVFTEITAQEELYEVLYYLKDKEEEKVRRIDEMLALMGLSRYKETNPYDLSGGEQQRLALGKVLMTKPDILLLDEPTKGLDPFFKRTLAGILKKLTDEGITVIMVTHDIEFSAEYADRCAMFFDGNVVSMETPRRFFSGNRFYTTTSHRVSREFFRDAIIYQDVVALCRENTI